MGAEATIRRNDGTHRVVTAVALASGEVQQLADGRAAFFEGLGAAEINDTVSLRKDGNTDYKCASGVTFSRGDPVFWDVANNTAVTLASAAAGDWYLGRAAKAKASGETVVLVDTNALGEAQCRGEGKLYVNVAASAAVTNTTAETAFDKTYSIPASKLKAGDVIKIRLFVTATATNSTDTLLIKLKLGTTILAATAAVDVADGDIAVVDVFLVVRTIGASGTMIAFGTQALGPAASATAKPVAMASSTIDTTAANVVQATATWSVANAGNSCRLDGLYVERLSDRVVL